MEVSKLKLPAPAEPTAVNPLVLALFNAPSPKKKSPPPPPPSPRLQDDKKRNQPAASPKKKEQAGKKDAGSSVDKKDSADGTPNDKKKATKTKKDKTKSNKRQKRSKDTEEEKDGEQAGQEETATTETVVDPEAEQDGAEEEEGDEEANTKSEMTEEMKKECTVFVGNVPVSVTKKDIKKIFVAYGKIHSIRFRSVAFALPKRRKEDKKAAFLGKHFHSQRTTCNVYIVYTDKESAIKALAANNTKLDMGDDAVHLSVDLAYAPTWNMARSAFVGNLPFDVQEEDVRSHFESAGTVKRVRIVRDSATFMGKGFGFIEFENKDDLLGALALHESELQGRTIRVFKASSHQANQKHLAKSKKDSGRAYQGMEAAPGAALRIARKRKHEAGGKPKRSGGNKNKKGKKPRTA